MALVFISHVEEDEAVALSLARGIEVEEDFETWYYERDSVPGPTYIQQTRDAIQRSGAVLLVLSQASIKSKQVGREIQNAYDHEIPLLPVLIDITYENFKVRQPDWHDLIGAAVYIQLGATPFRDSLDGIIAGLRVLLAHSRAESRNHQKTRRTLMGESHNILPKLVFAIGVCMLTLGLIAYIWWLPPPPPPTIITLNETEEVAGVIEAQSDTAGIRLTGTYDGVANDEKLFILVNARPRAATVWHLQDNPMKQFQRSTWSATVQLGSGNFPVRPGDEQEISVAIFSGPSTKTAEWIVNHRDVNGEFNEYPQDEDIKVFVYENILVRMVSANQR